MSGGGSKRHSRCLTVRCRSGIGGPSRARSLARDRETVPAHYTFGMWMAGRLADGVSERYVEDAVVHWAFQGQARQRP
jgi:hypothetical protein